MKEWIPKVGDRVYLRPWQNGKEQDNAPHGTNPAKDRHMDGTTIYTVRSVNPNSENGNRVYKWALTFHEAHSPYDTNPDDDYYWTYSEVCSIPLSHDVTEQVFDVLLGRKPVAPDSWTTEDV